MSAPNHHQRKQQGKISARRLFTAHPHAPHGVAHHRRGIARQFAHFRAAGISAFAAFVAVLGPGLADAALAASLFHDGKLQIPDLKAYLEQQGIPVRKVAYAG